MKYLGEMIIINEATYDRHRKHILVLKFTHFRVLSGFVKAVELIKARMRRKLHETGKIHIQLSNKRGEVAVLEVLRNNFLSAEHSQQGTQQRREKASTPYRCKG